MGINAPSDGHISIGRVHFQDFIIIFAKIYETIHALIEVPFSFSRPPMFVTNFHYDTDDVPRIRGLHSHLSTAFVTNT